MTQVAGEVADGIIIHAFTTEEYMRTVTMPAIEKGLEIGGRSRADFQVTYPGFVITGVDEQSFERARPIATKQIAFYGSTPAYKGVLDSIDAGELQGVLNTMSKEGKWDEMGTLITDDILHKFAVVGEPKDIAAEMQSPFRRSRRPCFVGLRDGAEGGSEGHHRGLACRLRRSRRERDMKVDGHGLRSEDGPGTCAREPRLRWRAQR